VLIVMPVKDQISFGKMQTEKSAFLFFNYYGRNSAFRTLSNFLRLTFYFLLPGLD
jgi:hypothetical protein